MSGSIGQNVTIANTGGAQADGLSVSAAVSDTSTTGQTGTVVSTQGTSYVPFVINPVIDPSITNQVSTASDPTTALQIETAITAAANYIDTHFTSSIPVGSKDGNGAIINAVTINIGFDYGTIETFLGNSVVAEPTTGTARSSFAGFLFNYSQVQSLLPNLPAVDPTNGGSFLLPDAQIKLLNATTYSNLPTSTSTEIDGYVGINTFANGTTLDWNVNSQSQPIAGENSAIGAIEHEITENFGTAFVKPLKEIVIRIECSLGGIEGFIDFLEGQSVFVRGGQRVGFNHLGEDHVICPARAAFHRDFLCPACEFDGGPGVVREGQPRVGARRK